jgi:hypothetical protein
LEGRELGGENRLSWILEGERGKYGIENKFLEEKIVGVVSFDT